jgi:hypothetical protein
MFRPERLDSMPRVLPDGTLGSLSGVRIVARTNFR